MATATNEIALLFVSGISIASVGLLESVAKVCVKPKARDYRWLRCRRVSAVVVGRTTCLRIKTSRLSLSPSRFSCSAGLLPGDYESFDVIAGSQCFLYCTSLLDKRPILLDQTSMTPPGLYSTAEKGASPPKPVVEEVDLHQMTAERLQSDK